METHIFTTPSTFHGTSISNHDFKIVEDKYVTIDFLGNAAMNKIMGVVTFKKDDEFPMLNVANYIEGLGSRESSERIQ